MDADEERIVGLAERLISALEDIAESISRLASK